MLRVLLRYRHQAVRDQLERFVEVLVHGHDVDVRAAVAVADERKRCVLESVPLANLRVA